MKNLLNRFAQDKAKELIQESNYTRVSNDINGNPRYVLHYLVFKPLEIKTIDIFNAYEYTKNHLGLGKFHNKQFGGGLIVPSYSLESDLRDILLSSVEKSFKNMVLKLIEEKLEGFPQVQFKTQKKMLKEFKNIYKVEADSLTPEGYIRGLGLPLDYIYNAEILDYFDHFFFPNSFDDTKKIEFYWQGLILALTQILEGK